jgi:hypothetical protein
MQIWIQLNRYAFLIKLRILYVKIHIFGKIKYDHLWIDITMPFTIQAYEKALNAENKALRIYRTYETSTFLFSNKDLTSIFPSFTTAIFQKIVYHINNNNSIVSYYNTLFRDTSINIEKLNKIETIDSLVKIYYYFPDVGSYFG